MFHEDEQWLPNDEDVRKAVNLIDPSPEYHNQCIHHVKKVIAGAREDQHARREFSKRSAKARTKALQRLETRFRRVRYALQDQDLDLDDFPKGIIEDIIEAWVRRCDELKKASPSRKAHLAHIVRATDKDDAARKAHWLMTHFGREFKANNFFKLAVLIYGKPSVKLTNQCQAFLRSPFVKSDLL